jgi:DNA-binding XRE family transcriptional regulator
MNRKEFAEVRDRLGKTQKQLAQLLGVSLKAIQSFEQGWRRIPVHTERQSLLLLALKQSGALKSRPCWLIKRCPADRRRNCPAWEFSAGQMCWLINGTVCEGKPQKSWAKKMAICKRCTVFQSALSSDAKGQTGDRPRRT